MKIVSIIGARPQFIKCAPVSRALRKDHQEILVHTGQHYDENMSGIFFEELSIPIPDYHLGIGSGSHGAQTGRMLAAIEEVLLKEEPDMVLVYGDTNSTLAGALAAAKLHIPVAHIEAGLRSYDRSMPEEMNRVLTDHASDLLFVPTENGVANLAREGIEKGVYRVGDVMVDALLFNRDLAGRSDILERLDLESGTYYLATVHRAGNTDEEKNLRSIMAAFAALDRPVIFPAHPRTRKFLEQYGIAAGRNVRLIEPLPYLDMLQLLSHACAILTDSGGVQKEAYILQVPCITLRENTEWVETVEDGWNVLAGADTGCIIAAVSQMTGDGGRSGIHSAHYGDGTAADKIRRIISAFDKE
ncbi:MAG: UDP-N-acetylglucosamine 2-epimerase (non-hydrolyzing) [Methanocalculus sp. MSAO_Arc1]|uniref:non-hydrolyzing UDP-N-acetylglucosamine 2-epimerase n=1 Tax=Methanocalculus sp. MSAO_Arc1 TaxID=2293854 RepID=UPI000FF22142|nr:UDP-N-acetylglucosamine 2-epimerase (non-hydrolyzing) [Methanocalculus sp. MSAO_Arc1]RQD81822.1 MAG: UDP-N-acetylglucosamine 2-epimerase (non-hydrolyzing) [Methanocalculus sp. MSAO_Arc1]